MHVTGLEIEAGGKTLAGVEHRARGFGAGFLEPIEQVAAALAEREDHVVAGIAERAGDVGAALFQRAGDALGDFIDAGRDRIRDQGDIVAKVDLHAGDGAANLLGLADQIVALVGDILQQRADAHLVVAVGALERRDFVGNQGLEFAGTRDRALDAVAHGGDFAADRLADGHHRVAGRALGLRETDRDLRHRLRDHAQFLTAPGKTGEEIDQQHRRDEQCREAGERQYAAAALTDRGPQRWQEADHQDGRADDPDRGKKRGEGVDAAGGPALLNGLQNLPDGFAVVIGGAACRARLLDRIEDLPIARSAGRRTCCRRRAGCRGCSSASHRCAANRGRRRRSGASLMLRASWMAESATSVGSLTFFGLFAMFSLSPLCTLRDRTVLREMPLQARSRPQCPARRQGAGAGRLVRYIRKHPIGKAMRMKWSRLTQS